MKLIKKITILSGLLLLLMLTYSIYTVYKPTYFINGGISKDIDFEVKSFSLLQPKYIGYQYDGGYDRYNALEIELKRDAFLRWDIIDKNTKTSIVLKSDIKKFKEEAKKDYKKIEELKFVDKYVINKNDTFEQREYKKEWHPPTRENSIHYNLDKFKLLKSGMLCIDWVNIIEASDFRLTPSEFYPGFYRDVYNIGSKKVNFVFTTFKEGYPCVNEPDEIKLVDIVIITQTQEMVKVPVNPDGTYNWEAVKDKID